MNSLYVASLLLRQSAVDVLLQDLEVARHRVKRSPELVTQAREKLGLDAIRRLGILARRLLSLERQLQLPRPLRDTRIEGPIEGVHAVLGLLADADVAQQPAERFFPARRRLQNRHSRFDGNHLSIHHAHFQLALVESVSAWQRQQALIELAANARMYE